MARKVARFEDGKRVIHTINAKRSKIAKKAARKKHRKVSSATRAKISKALKKSFKAGDAKKAMKYKLKKLKKVRGPHSDEHKAKISKGIKRHHKLKKKALKAGKVYKKRKVRSDVGSKKGPRISRKLVRSMSE